MSVYKRKGSPYFHFDFVRAGRRFYGSTGVTTKRDAEAYERKIRADAALGRLDERADMTLDAAAERWWQERGQFLKSAPDVDRRLAVMVKLVGGGKMLSAIDSGVIAEAVQKRRGTATRRKRLPSSATVNHDVVRALRPVLRRAARTWKIPGLPAIDWGELLLAEPKPQAREFTAAEMARFMAALPEHWRDFAAFMAGYGPRLGEMFFRPSDVDVAGQRVTLRSRKAGDDHVIPLLPDDAAMLASRVSRAEAAGLDTVWFRARGRHLIALTYGQAQWALHKALGDAGLKASKGARIHDLRHHAGTAIMRATGNLQVARRLLGHASIQSTVRYAHATEGDLRSGLESVSKSRHSTADALASNGETVIVKGVAGNE